MKKVLSFIFVIVLTLALVIGVCAVTTDELVPDTEGADTEVPVPNTDNASEIVKETSNRITTILGISGTVGVGAIIIAVIAFFLKHLKSVKSIITSLTSVFSSIFSKDGKVENVPQAFKDITDDIKTLNKEFNVELAKLQKELEKEKESNEQFKHILSVFIINSNYINPYAKNELIQLICGEKGFGMTIKDTIMNINESVTMAVNSEIKPETPYLDKITSDVEEK